MNLQSNKETDVPWAARKIWGVAIEGCGYEGKTELIAEGLTRAEAKTVLISIRKSLKPGFHAYIFP